MKWLIQAPVLFIVLISCLVSSAHAWDTEEYEMFDLVEEVGQNFYEVLDVPQDVSAKELKAAYRKLSLKLHPDKNPAPDASEKFRQLVGIYEVLKDNNLRVSYNQVLRDGLPNWRHPSFYFRRVRKLELWQVGLIVLTIVSVCQYFGKYASYWEKKLALQEQIDTKLRRVQRIRKQAKEGKETEQQLKAEAEKYLTKPSIYDLAPFQICRGIKYTIFSLPGDTINFIKELKAEKERERLKIEKELEDTERARQLAEEAKNKPKKRKIVHIPQKKAGDDDNAAPNWGPKEGSAQSKSSAPPVVSGGLWTDDDISELVRLCSKFPGGTPERWETIASFLRRPVPEVTFMAKKVLERLATKKAEEDDTAGHQPKVKVKTKGNAVDNADTSSAENWSAEEQKALEAALLMYPKGSLERWEKIAKAVRGRSKEECMQRFKYLAETVRKNKEEKERKLKEEEDQINGVPEQEEEEENQVEVDEEEDQDEDEGLETDSEEEDDEETDSES